MFCDWEFLGRSLVRPWFLLGLLPEREREGTRGRNLNNRTQLTNSFLQIDARIAQTAGDVVSLPPMQGRGGSAVIVLRCCLGTKHTITHLNAI